jgi:hypothetical protein
LEVVFDFNWYGHSIPIIIFMLLTVS